jgi:hypothetical protein
MLNSRENGEKVKKATNSGFVDRATLGAVITGAAIAAVSVMAAK